MGASRPEASRSSKIATTRHQFGKTVGALAKKPSKVEMEFGASLTGKTDLWVVSGEGKAEFKVKLVWEGDEGA